MGMRFPEKFRVRHPGKGYESEAGDRFGVFYIPPSACRTGLHARRDPLRIIATDGMGVAGADGLAWEHVSVSVAHRCPTWSEMAIVKDLFWDAEDVVLQYHPARSEYVNNHPFVLHLWRPVTVTGTPWALPRPPSILVGIVGGDASQTIAEAQR